MQLTEKAFLDLIQQHKGIIHKVTRMYCDSPEDREDLMQEIILQTWKALPSFKGNSEFSTWLYRISLNMALVFLKKDKKRVDAPADREFHAIESEEYDAAKDRQLAVFYQAVKGLDKVDRALILLLIEGKSGKEIADILGLSEVNVRVKTNRAKQKLKELVNKQGHEL